MVQLQFLRLSVFALVLAAHTLHVDNLRAEVPESISDGEFEELHRMIKPQAGESRWMEIDWYPSIWEARQHAAAEGKPIFMMAGSGGAPVAGC